MVSLVCPDGHDLTGTLERIYGVAQIAGPVTRDQHGRVGFEYGGYTEVDWNSQTSVTVELLAAGDQAGTDRIFVCENGESWPESQLMGKKLAQRRAELAKQRAAS